MGTEIHKSGAIQRRGCAAARGMVLAILGQLSLWVVTSDGQTLYSIGDPSPDAQLSLELINRARSNPTAEGLWLAALDDPSIQAEYSWWPVNLNTMKNEFANLSARAPLSFNEHLIVSSQGHSADMRAVGFQAHTSSNSATWPGVSLGTRVSNSGYTDWSIVSENVYSFSQGVVHGHASFQVDWGAGSGGMINGRGHRANIHSSNYKEIGIGIAYGQNGEYGFEYVTQDFGSRFDFPTFITGVAYYDLDGDGFYDPAEGIGGVEVQVAGAEYYAITSDSGGYSVPVSGDGDHTVTFKMAGVADHVEVATVSAANNVKIDYLPPYSPPTVSGPLTVAVGAPAAFAYGEVAGAQSHDMMTASVDSTPAGEGGENGGAGLDWSVTGGYNVLQANVVRSGGRAIHLAHSSIYSRQQTVEFARSFVPRAGANLRFYSRLRASDEGQWSKVEVSDDDGAGWDIVWRQQGAFGNGASNFSQKNVSLAAYAGKHIRLRFSYLITAGYLYIGTSAAYGWYIDDISFTGIDELLSTEVRAVNGGSFDYVPDANGSERIYVRGVAAGQTLPWSAGVDITATANDYASWATRFETENGLSAGALADLSGDYDGDGLIQAYEYALEANGLDPTSGQFWGPAVELVDGFWILDYAVDAGRPDVAVEVLASMDLDSWYTKNEPGRPTGFVDEYLGPGTGSIENWRAKVPANTGATFMRLRVSVSEP